TQIQGGLSASPDEISWVQTSYMVAEVVAIPLTGTLSRLLSTRVLFVISALGFTFMSAMCATATNLDQMIVYRALQGFIGGAMVPSVFPVVYTVFPPRQLATAMVIISLILNLSSTLGPTVGGYLTDTYSWHWLFLVNIVPGIAVATAVWCLIDVDKPDRSILHNFDLIGLVLMALFLGCLEYTLEEGERWDWLADPTIRTTITVSAVAAALFFWRVLTFRQPIVDLRAFRNRNFTLGTTFTFIIGIGLYSGTYVVPLFLAEVRGYSPLEIGTTVFVTGTAQFCVAPIIAPLARKIDLRLMLGFGMAMFAFAVYLNAGMTHETGFNELFLPQILRGVGLMFCFVPANLMALSTLPPNMLKNASGLYNLMRNLGGAIALALLGTMMNGRLHFHWNRLIEAVNPARPGIQHFIDAQTDRFASQISGDPHQAAVVLLGRLVQREALVLTFNDVMMVLAGVFVVGILLMPLVRRSRSALSAGR
ncbi:MAG: DHA2 family efflux MFS transporter permease subunit, partial [Stellaceae bacterium]